MPETKALQFTLPSTGLILDTQGVVTPPPAEVALAPGTQAVWVQSPDVKAEVRTPQLPRQLVEHIEQALRAAYAWPTPLPPQAPVAVLDRRTRLLARPVRCDGLTSPVNVQLTLSLGFRRTPPDSKRPDIDHE